MAIPIHNLSLKQGNRRTVILFTLLCAHFIALLAGLLYSHIAHRCNLPVFIPVIVNPPDRKLANSTSVHWARGFKILLGLILMDSSRIPPEGLRIEIYSIPVKGRDIFSRFNLTPTYVYSTAILF